MHSEKLSFDGRVVVITGSGGGLGKVYAIEFAKRGAKVVVNDLGGTLSGSGSNSKAADLVVQEIKEKHGGIAVANYDSVTDNAAHIIETAINSFGRIDIIINNAGILRDASFTKMTLKEFQVVIDVHANGAFKLTKAAWPYMRKQKFGRIINTASPAGLYGNFGQANYAAAKMGLIGLAKTLAKEGAKYNINVNAIAPLARSRMTEKILPPHILNMLGAEKIAPLVLFLSHESTAVTNSIFELAAGFYGQLRWERSGGQLFNPNEKTLTPEALLTKSSCITNFSKDKSSVQHPDQLANFNELILEAKKLPLANEQGRKQILSLKDKVVIITGAAGGLGKSHAKWFLRYGAKVIVNDIKNAKVACDELNKSTQSQNAFPDSHDLITESDKIIESAVQKFGRVDVLVNNAGILRDRSFLNMTEKEWNDVVNIHLIATFQLTKAVWNVFVKQGSGFIINTTSTSGIYGNFGQANYSFAKAAVIGLTKTLAIEGKKKGIIVNAIAPHAETAMTKTIFTSTELDNHFDPTFVSPLVLLLASSELQDSAKNGVTGELFEAGGGWFTSTRWQRSSGHVIMKPDVSPEDIRDNWSKITDFSDRRAVYPTSTNESSMHILQAVQKAQSRTNASDIFRYTHKEVILYNIGIGATSKELCYTYENDPSFQALPTFGVIPFMSSTALTDMDSLVDNFNYAALLHGEQYMKLHSIRIPVRGTMKTVVKPLQVIDKHGKAAVIVMEYKTYDEKSKNLLLTNEGTYFVRGAKVKQNKGQIREPRASFATKNFRVPDRDADFEVLVKTTIDQAAIYRLSGDYNPLHIDPVVATSVRFPSPILHGLCTMGITGKALYEKYGHFDEIKVRFTDVVFPGETIKIRAWKDVGDVIIFQSIANERNKVVIDSAAVKLVGSTAKF